MLTSAFLLSLALVASAAPAKRAAPTVQLDSATFTGTSSGKVSKFLGIPFGQTTGPPNRFALPIPVAPYIGSQQATSFGPSCPQQAIISPNALPSFLPESAVDTILNTFLQIVLPTSEDCLSVNVVIPSGTKPGANLPVVAWIYGGGFEFGGTSTYDGSVPVSRSIALGEPVVYVSMNYRVSAWGFLPGQEVKDQGVGNLGLQDQRLAFRWIQKYISNFGGDPTKVTIWGESAGAISVSLHMITNNGNTEGLFRAGFMQSGSPTPIGDISHGQADYDTLVQNTGCAGSADTLDCLRSVPEATLQNAADISASIFSNRSLNLAWQPRTDGVFLTDVPQKLVQQGSVANIPFITGDNDDEGTLFSIQLVNVNTDAKFISFLQTNFLPSATPAQIAAVGSAYPNDITQGSPFDTGILNAETSQYKRIAAFQGDVAFQAPRRFFLENTSAKQATWSFLNKRLKGLPFLGAAHATDLLQTALGDGELLDYLIHFVNHLNPNTNSNLMNWPQYNTGSRSLLTLLDGLIPLTVSADTYRASAMNLLTSLGLSTPLKRM